MSKKFFYPGGTLPGNIPSYVERAADTALLEALMAGEFCYVLDTRQVGKSSLMVRTAQRLLEVGQHAAILDISSIGENLSQEQWYFGLLTNLAVACDLEAEAEDYWLQHPHLGFVQRWFMALRSVFLPRLKGPLIIFVDEIDAVRKLSFSVDEFFAAIRECHNRRAADSTNLQVTFCLMGVATPSDLIQDVRTTPFNIGQRVELHDFSLAETLPLADGLPGTTEKQNEQIKRVWYWTAGHPYLTQKFCQALASRGIPLASSEIDALCHTIFLRRQAQEEEDNLKFVSRQVLFDEATRADILTLYGRIRAGKRFDLGDAPDALVKRLLLAGLVYPVPERQRLVLRNRIYAAAFDAAWAKANMPHAEIRRQQTAMWRGFLRATLVWACFAGLVGVTLYEINHAASETGRADQAVSDKRQLIQQKAALETENTQARALRDESLRQLHTTEAQTKNLRRDLHVTAGELKKQRAALQGIKAAFTVQTAHGRDLKRKNQRLIDGINSMVGPLAMAGHGHELDALDFGLSNVEPALSNHTPPDRSAMQVVVDAVCAGVVRRLRLIHPDHVFDAALSPDNTRIVTAGRGHYAYVWDVLTGKLVQRLAVIAAHDPAQNINGASYSRDGKWILTASNDHRVRLWDATRQEVLQTTPLLTLAVGRSPSTNAALSDDGQRLVTTDSKNTVDLWQLTVLAEHVPIRYSLLKSLPGLSEATENAKNDIWAVDVSHDGRWIAAGGTDQIVHVWNADTGLPLRSDERPHRKTIRSVRFSAWNDHLISAGEDFSARLWALNPALGTRNEYHGQLDTVCDAEVGGADLYVATAGNERNVRIWPMNPSLRPLYVLSTHTDTVWGCRFAADGRSLVTASSDHTSEFWQLTTPTFSVSNGYMQCATFSSDGRYVVCCRGEGIASVWDWQSGQHIGHVQAGRQISISCRHAVFSHNGRWIATASSDGSVRLWELAQCSRDKIATTPSMVLQDGIGKPVYTVAYSPDDRWVLTACADGTAVLWDSRTGKRERTFQDSSSAIFSAFFAPDGHHIATTSKDGGIRIWDIATPQHPQLVLIPPDRERAGSGTAPMSAVFSPDGRYVLSADTNHCAYLWEAQTGKFVREMEGHGAALTVAVFSPNGKWIATGSADRSVCLWDTAEVLSTPKPTPLYKIKSHASDIAWVDFSSDSKWLTTASRDGTCRVYPATFEGMVAKAKELVQNPYHESRVPDFK